MVFEDFEDFSQEAVCHEHVRRADIDRYNAVFSSDRFDAAFFSQVFAVDDGAFRFRVEGVEQFDGHTAFSGRSNTERVKNLGSKVGKLRSFSITQFIDAACLLDDAGIIVMDTIDVCPNLDFISE